MGFTNAFTTPLLLASLADAIPPEKLSRAVGLFSSCLAAGQSFAPLVGGAAASIGWQSAFVVVAAVAAVFAALPPHGAPRQVRTHHRFGRCSLRRSASCRPNPVSYLGASSLPFMVALYAEEQLSVSAAKTGVLLLGFGLAGLLLGTSWGRLMRPLRSNYLCGSIASSIHCDMRRGRRSEPTTR